MFFSSTPFHYKVDEIKEIDSHPGLLSVWSWHVLPMSAWVFSRCSSFLHTQSCACEVHGHDSLSVRVCECVGLGECVSVCEWPFHCRVSCLEWGPTWGLELLGQAPATHSPELESMDWKIIILLGFYSFF